jgi:TPR repeat protein
MAHGSEKIGEALMSTQEDDELSQSLYEEAMQYNWRGPESLANAPIARAKFERAAALKYRKALRELAEMMFVGAGCPREPERALGLKWGACALGDYEALEELSALLGSYAEDSENNKDAHRASLAAEKAEEAHKLLEWLSGYIHDVSRYAHLSVGQA